MNVVSLVPSLTELLIDLGVNVVGRTRFCIHPADKITSIPVIGGTKNPNISKIKSIKPDLIVANKEENNASDIAQLSTCCEVIVTDIKTVEDALKSILMLGEVTKTFQKAVKLHDEIKNCLPVYRFPQELKVVYLIWKNPLMSVGYDTYIHDVLRVYGCSNLFANQSRYPETSFESIRMLKPDIILLSSEPYPFSQKHSIEFVREVPSAKIECVNGEWFSWYGSRMLDAFKRLQHWRENLDF